MSVYFAAFFISLSLFSSTSAIQQFSVSNILKEAENQRHSSVSEEVDNETLSTQEDIIFDVKELYVEQRLDHFTSYPSNFGSAPHSFSQRYFYTDRYTKFADPHNHHHLRRDETFGKENAAPVFVFICIGGEGPSMGKSVLTNSVHCSGDMLESAKILSKEKNVIVHVFALEHRYYGKSYPKFHDGSSPVSNENLLYLSSRQALADLAHFVEYAKEKYSIPVNSPVVTFGGSYPGMLAAWSRLKYPHLIYAAVSNSAPIEVILDFPQYKDVFAKSISNPAVGGSLKCLDVIRKGHEEISAMLSKGGDSVKEYVASSFNICNGTDAFLDEKNVNSFLGDGVVFFDVQSNDPSCEEDLCNIEKFCNFITEQADDTSESAVEILSKLSNKMERGCKNISWEESIAYLSSPMARLGGNRSWLWQTCTEVGFYQTCETGSKCPFGRGYHTLDMDLEICERAYGIDAQSVKENVKGTLTYYGGWNISSSRILSVNGDVDPWSAMSYSNSGRNSEDLPSIWSYGSSHHFWTHEVKDNDGTSITETRDYIYKWLIDVLFDEESMRKVHPEVPKLSTL